MNLDQLAAILHPQELELLSELADELAELDEYDLDQAAPVAPTREDYLQAILGAPGLTPPTRKRGKSRKKKKKPDDLNDYEREHNAELGDEVKESVKHTGRRAAVPTREEIRHVLETSKDHGRDHMMMRLFYATGARRFEIETMVLADLHLEEQKIFIRNGKNDIDRYVLVDKKTARMLADFVYGRALDDPIFDIGATQMNNRVKHWGRKSGLDERYAAQNRKLTCHSFRHAYGTHTYESGLDLVTIKNLMGHRFLSSTLTYIHLGIARNLNSYEQAHPFAQKPRYDD